MLQPGWSTGAQRRRPGGGGEVPLRASQEWAAVYGFEVKGLLDSSDEGSFFDMLYVGGIIWVKGGILWFSGKLEVCSLLPSNGVDRVDPVDFPHLGVCPVEIAT